MEVMSLADQHFALLLSEKEYTDRQIATNLATNVKLLGTIFTAIIAALGWLFATETGSALSPDKVGIVLLALVALSSITSLMSTMFNGYTFSYIAYKSGHLGPRLAEHLELPSNPLVASEYIARTSAGKTTVLATILLSTGQHLLSLVLLVAGALPLRGTPLFWIAVPLTALLFLAALAAALAALGTMRDQQKPSAMAR